MVEHCQQVHHKLVVVMGSQEPGSTVVNAAMNILSVNLPIATRDYYTHTRSYQHLYKERASHTGLFQLATQLLKGRPITVFCVQLLWPPSCNLIYDK